MAYEMLQARQANAPRVGEKAPGFLLYSLDRNREVSLGELIEKKPVVLLFGSWGCDILRETHGGLSSLYLKYKDDVNFVMIYTREVHPSDGFAGDLGRVPDPTSDAARRKVANRCKEQLRLPFEMLVDGIEDRAATRWGGMPVRLFVVDRDGTVIYSGAQGPWGFRPYKGYLHGDGKRVGWDYDFSWETLEEFLAKKYPDSP